MKGYLWRCEVAGSANIVRSNEIHGKLRRTYVNNLFRNSSWYCIVALPLGFSNTSLISCEGDDR